MALSTQRQAFVDAMLITHQQTAAARLAGYHHPWEMGHRLMKNPEIQAAIAAAIEQYAMQKPEVLARLAEQARVNIGDFLTDTGALDMQALKDRGHLVKSVKWNKYGQLVSLELHDGQTALITIAKHLQLLTERVDVTSGGEKVKFVALAPESSDGAG